MKTSTQSASRLIRLGLLILFFSIQGAFTDPRLRFAITDLGTLPGAERIMASKVNNLGQIVGTAQDSNGFARAFIYSGGVMSELNVGSNGGIAVDINDHGAVIGTSGDGFLFLYQNGTTINLNALAGRQLWAVRGINNDGVIVGDAPLTEDPPRFAGAFAIHNGEFRWLGTLPGGVYSDAGGVNNLGQIAGQGSLPVGGGLVGHAVVWDGDRIFDLGTLPGTTTSLSTGINDHGEVIGYTDSRGFIYTGGAMKALPELPGHAYSSPYDINNSGFVVGQATDSSFNERRAFLYGRGFTYDLNDLIPADSGWFLVSADGINEAGEIVGFGLYQEQLRSFILTPLKKLKPHPQR
jgi:probable HAF family extracellular repeat protein